MRTRTGRAGPPQSAGPVPAPADLTQVSLVRAPGADEPDLPHERDEAPGEPPPKPDSHMVQAAQDLAEGKLDTDLRAAHSVFLKRFGRFR